MTFVMFRRLSEELPELHMESYRLDVIVYFLTWEFFGIPDIPMSKIYDKLINFITHFQHFWKHFEKNSRNS